jgi:hypothetical protein
MTEAYEVVLRKSLDNVDRRQKKMKIIAVVSVVLASASSALAMINLTDLRLLYIATFVGMTFWTGGLAVAILANSNRNAQLALRAIALLSESAAANRSVQPISATGSKQQS